MESDSSESSVDHVPIITQEIQQLADSLKQTNDNLYTFQFMLNQYKKLARVAPIKIDEKKDMIEEELKRISQSIQKLEAKDDCITTNFQELKEFMKQPSQSSLNELDIAQLKELIFVLKEKITNQDNHCAKLTERNVWLETELKSEKEKNTILNQKLDAEKRAAQVVGRDVQKYVEYAKKLEEEISTFRKEAKRSSKLDVTDSTLNESSMLCKTCIIANDDSMENLQIVVDKVQKIAEQIETQNEHLVKEFRKSKNDVNDTVPNTNILVECSHQTENQSINQRRLEFAEIMAERNSLHVINEKLTLEIDRLQQENDEKDVKYHSLKSKCKILLGKYKSKTTSNTAVEKLKSAKKVLTDLQKLFTVKDANHLILMNYFGSQIEIFGRILSAFRGEKKFNGPPLNVEAHKKLTVWFTSVHSVSIWCQKEILALGKRQWTENEDHYFIKTGIKPDCDTLSEISTALDQEDERLPIEVLKALQSQVSVFHETEKNVSDLKNVLC